MFSCVCPLSFRIITNLITILRNNRNLCLWQPLRWSYLWGIHGLFLRYQRCRPFSYTARLFCAPSMWEFTMSHYPSRIFNFICLLAASSLLSVFIRCWAEVRLRGKTYCRGDCHSLGQFGQRVVSVGLDVFGTPPKVLLWLNCVDRSSIPRSGLSTSQVISSMKFDIFIQLEFKNSCSMTRVVPKSVVGVVEIVWGL